MIDLTAIAVVCPPTTSPGPSSSEVMARHILNELEENDVSTSYLRVTEHQVECGVQIDMGSCDKWPAIRKQILDADILVLSTQLGHPCSVARQLMERLDADLSETENQGRPIIYGKVATLAIAGIEDGGHKTIADMMQGMNDIGFTIPAQGATYWSGEAVQTMDPKDLEQVPDAVAATNAGLARNAAHLAWILRNQQYPAE